MLYQFDCIVNDNDLYELNKYQMKNSANLKKINLLGRLIVPVMLLIAIIYYIARGYDIRFAATIFGIVSVIWVFFIAEPLGFLSLKLFIKRMKKHGDTPYSSSVTMQFYNDYFVETTRSVKTEIKYDVITNVCINDKKAIYIYQSTPMAHIIPFNAFESDEQAEEFVEFIKRKVNKEALERSV